MAASSSPERELQEELKDAGNRLLTPSSSTHELLSLLDKVEHLLSRVEQAPSRLMQDALLPLKKALIAQELLRHSEIDVKVSVATCINELTRVTAPDVPYDDEPMKEIFEVTVMALEKLSLASGHCYTKAVSILGTVASVRSCLVMLDLECDELIVEMFQLFFNTIRSDHPHSVFSDMEAIMTLVIDESEEIPLELLIPLLSSVKNENRNVSPLSWNLGENVLRKCATKLKPYLPPAVQFMRIDLDEFAEIVFSICQDAFGEVGEDLAGSSLDGSSRSLMNDSTAQMRGLDTLGDEKSGKRTDARSKSYPDHFDSTMAVNEGTEREIVVKKRGRKPNSLIKPEEGYDRSWLSGERKGQRLSHHIKNHEKGRPSKDSVAKEAAQSETENETIRQIFSLKRSRRETIDENHDKRGWPNKKGNLMYQERDPDALLVPKGDLVRPQEKASQSADFILVKGSEVARNLKAKLERGSKKGNVVMKKEDGIPSGPEGKQEAAVPHMDGKKQSRGSSISGKHVRNKSSDKKTISFSASGSLNKDESQLDEASRTKCKRKRTPRKEEVSEMTREVKNYGEELVGCEIKVWWPLDRKFYEGAICSFDPMEKKHTVLYADGDEETLDLSTERWTLVGRNDFPEQEKETDHRICDTSSDIPQKKKSKIKLESSTTRKFVASSSERVSNSGGASAGKSLADGTK